MPADVLHFETYRGRRFGNLPNLLRELYAYRRLEQRLHLFTQIVQHLLLR